MIQIYRRQGKVKFKSPNMDRTLRVEAIMKTLIIITLRQRIVGALSSSILVYPELLIPHDPIIELRWQKCEFELLKTPQLSIFLSQARDLTISIDTGRPCEERVERDPGPRYCNLFEIFPVRVPIFFNSSMRRSLSHFVAFR